MKIMKRFFAILLTYILALSLPFAVRADDLNAAAKTGNREMIGVVIAFIAFVITAFITTKLTRNKNKLDNKK